MKRKEIVILFLILIGMSTRFLFIVDGQSILPNFTAVGAIAILGATYLKGIKKWVLPLAVLWISDIILNNFIYGAYFDHFQIFGNLWVYGSLILVGLVAYKIMRKASWARLALTSIVGAVLFYLVTNFGVWVSMSSPYSKDWGGLMQSYMAGIPFFRNMLLGNLFFSFALFGCYSYLAGRVKEIQPFMTGNSVSEI